MNISGVGITGLSIFDDGTLPPVAPANTAVPTISGTVTIGSTLTSTTGSWTGTPTPTFAYEWQRGTTPIAGATNSTYVIQAADYNSTIRCVVTATNAGGSASANSANTVVVPAQAPVNTAVPTISGTVTIGSTLTSTTGSWTGTPTPTYAYQWQRGVANISGATASTYVIQSADYNSTIRCVVTATNAGGSATANSANTVVVPAQAPVNTAVPTISGTPASGSTLTSTTGTWTGTPTPTFAYEWQRGTTPISGATASTYVCQPADIGSTLRCVVTATNAGGSATANSANTSVVTEAVPVNTAVPTISGTVSVGNTLTSTTGSWTGNPTYAYQWQRGVANISGATNSTYVIQAADAESTLRCVVTATNAGGSTAANSANTVTVPAVAPVNTAVPTISGTVAIGNTLTSTTGTWTGAPTPTFAYQWQRGVTNISGATNSTYVIQTADYGNTLRCVVTATNAGGSAAANSANTVTVPAQAPAPTVLPTISGTVTIGSTLTSTTGSWSAIPAPTYAYQWQRGVTNISGATNSTYVIQADDYNNTLRCVVTATNAGGSAAAASANTVTVPAQAPANTAVPTVSGTVTVGSTLTSTTGTWTGTPTPTFTYQWQQNTSNISGATNSTYVIQAADAGSTLRCVVTATNPGGSAAANSANTVVVPGQAQFTTAGTFSWTAPAGVTSVCVVAVGGGGGGVSTISGGNGGGGGGLGWKNNIAVVPGTSYTVTVGAGGTSSSSAASSTNGGQSLFIDAATVAGNGGGRATSATASTAVGGTFVGDGGGNGGRGSRSISTATAGGGGGAGGYAGAGGQASAGSQTGSTGLGGGGGGGGGAGTGDTAGSGGGVGLLGQGTNGAGGAGTTADGRGGFGGSGGTDASQASTSTTAVNVYSTTIQSIPGLYGGGAAGSDVSVLETTNGAVGAVRIIWGANRAFPSTNTGNV
jgi:hypothetical protein